MTPKKAPAIKHTSGTWDHSADQHAYFLAASVNPLRFSNAGHPYLLIALNELMSPKAGSRGVVDAAVAKIELLIDNGHKLLIDSGIFWLASSHAAEHPDVPIDVAFGLPPTEMNNFDLLLECYLEVHARFGDRAWGYIEMDQGGPINKRKTRKLLESKGVTPIPVYHPLIDGWDYFDELAQQYDRIAIGNVGQATITVRKQIVMALWERHRQYPDTWLHMLGYTPDPTAIGWPFDSADSSTWISGLRWGTLKDRSLLRPIGNLNDGWRYQLESDNDAPNGWTAAARVSATTHTVNQMNWRNYLRTLRDEIGAPSYPAHLAGEAQFANPTKYESQGE